MTDTYTYVARINKQLVVGPFFDDEDDAYEALIRAMSKYSHEDLSNNCDWRLVTSTDDLQYYVGLHVKACITGNASIVLS